MSLKIRKKYQLPLYKKIPNVIFDVETLRHEVEKLNKYWTNVYEANKGLCSNHPYLAQENYKYFDQINLTGLSKNVKSVSFFHSDSSKISELQKNCDELAKKTLKNLDGLEVIKEK